MDSIRGLDGVPAHKRKHLKQIQATVGILEQRLQRAPEEEEIAAELGTSPCAGLSGNASGITRGEPGAVWMRRRSATRFSRSLIHFIATPEENSPARLLERSELEKLITEAEENATEWKGWCWISTTARNWGFGRSAPLFWVYTSSARVSQIKACRRFWRLRYYLQRHCPRPKGRIRHA